jgi:hypothetical protein
MPSTPNRITESQREIARLVRRTMAAYRSARAVGEWHPSASDTRRYAWPDKFDVLEVAALADRATSIAVELSATYADEPISGDPARWAADELTVKFHSRAGIETVISCRRSAQDTLELAALPPDIAALLPVIKWVLTMAVEGSY